MRDNPNVDALMSTVGGTAAQTVGGPNFGQLLVRLKPRAQRTAGVEEIIRELQPKLAEVPGMKVYLQNPPTIRIGGQVTKSLYQFSMQSPVKPELFANAQKMEKLIAEIPGVRDVTSDLAITSPQVEVNIDRDKAASLQVSANSVESAFYDAYGPHWVSTIYAAINEYEVLLELKPKFQSDPNLLSQLYFKTTGGQLIPLDTLATLTTDVGPQAINHNGQLTAVTISFDLATGRCARSGDGQDPGRGRQDAAFQHQHQFPGRGESVRKFARESLGAADHRHRGCLYRAGDSV